MYVEQVCKIELRLGYLSLLELDIYPLLCSSNFAVVNRRARIQFPCWVGGGFGVNSELRSDICCRY